VEEAREKRSQKNLKDKTGRISQDANIFTVQALLWIQDA
jgi:hypothetical protein